MVSTRPSPNPAKGRIAYPVAAPYVPGDSDNSPTYLGGPDGIRKVTSRDSDKERAQALKQWWKGFRDRPEAKQSEQQKGVFGMPLSESVEYASVQISTAGPDGALYVWGVIPVVVAKCGLYLKENGTEVEGTFRISGSAKRMRDLQAVFDTGPKFGKNIDWKTLPYTTHDVATIFRRFLTQMPEPAIPFDFYDEFRDLYARELPTEEAVEEYKILIRSLPPINQYLLLYVLDLLHVYSRNSDKNLMTAPNLALIFQPGMLSHPVHALRPKDHVLSQQVLEFLIEHQDHFLIGMQLSKKKRGDVTPSPSPPPRVDTPPPPPPLRADPDLMLPSDSDDDAPEGGYYIIESNRPEVAEPLNTPPQSPPTAPAALPVDASLLPRQTVDASLLPEKPVRLAPRPIMETMQASDSDEEAPKAGYEVRTVGPAEARAAVIAKVKSRSEAERVKAAALNKSEAAKIKDAARLSAAKGKEAAKLDDTKDRDAAKSGAVKDKDGVARRRSSTKKKAGEGTKVKNVVKEEA